MFDPLSGELEGEAGPGLDRLPQWPAERIRTRAGEIAAALARGELSRPELENALACWSVLIDEGIVVEAFALIGTELHRLDGTSLVAGAIPDLAKAAVAGTSVKRIIENPQAAWVLAELGRVAPATYQPLRDELCAQPDWNGAVRLLDQAVRSAAKAYLRQRTEAEGR